MNPILLQSQIEDQSPNLNLSLKPNYDPMLQESIKSFIAGIRRENFNSAEFRSVILRHLLSTENPSLEMVWLYSAAIYHERVSSLDRVSAARNLIQLLSAFAAAGSSSKSIAMIAPAVYDLHRCAGEGLVEAKEMECLAEGILSYVSICCSQNRDFDEGSAALNPCFVDVVKVWTMGDSGGGGGLEGFFPLISGGVLRRFEVEGCGIGYLAGVVIAEAFLIRLCLKVRGGGGLRKELRKELGIWAVSSITAFGNRIFFGRFVVLFFLHFWGCFVIVWFDVWMFVMCYNLYDLC